mgnify:CR=1 FL=1
MLHLGLIGAGNFAGKHFAVLQGMGERAKVALVARDRVKEPFEPAPELPVVAFDEAVADPHLDAVMISSPNHLHRRHAEAALNAGKHVFCEKPLALSVEDVDALTAAARRTDRVLMVGHLTRHAPMYAAAAEVVHSGRLGAVRAVHATRWHTRDKASDWRMRPEQGGGAPFDLLLHDYDLVQWLCGPPTGVTATGQKHPLGAYERMAASFTCPNGVVATVDGGFVLPSGASMKSSLRVIGTDGVLELQTPSEHPVQVRMHGDDPETIPVDPERLGADGLRTEFLEFFDAIEGRAWNRLRLEDARNAVAMAAAAVGAAESGRTVAIT